MKYILSSLVLVLFMSAFVACDKDDSKMTAEKELEQLADYIAKEGIKTQPTASGLYFIEVEKGNGEKPQKGQEVEVHYRGTLLNGDVFDSSYNRGPLKFTLGTGRVISGWDEGIAMLEEGGEAKLIIPSDLAYGSRGSGSIEPYSTLIFDVALVKIHK